MWICNLLNKSHLKLLVIKELKDFTLLVVLIIVSRLEISLNKYKSLINNRLTYNSLFYNNLNCNSSISKNWTSNLKSLVY